MQIDPHQAIRTSGAGYRQAPAFYSADGSISGPGGSGSPGYSSMQRADHLPPDGPANWSSNDGIWRNGLDCNGDPLNGTPKAHNSSRALTSADLSVNKRGPGSLLAGELTTYTIVLSNTDQLPAEPAWLTDVLLAHVGFVSQQAPYHSTSRYGARWRGTW